MANSRLTKPFSKIFEQVVKPVTDIADAHLELLGYFLIFKILKIFHLDHGPIPLLHFRNKHLDHPDRFKAAEFNVRSFQRRFPIARRFIERFPFVFAKNIKGEISHAAKKPSSRNLNFLPVFVKL
jgi:hypothetical protein